MSVPASLSDVLLSRLREHLRTARYGRGANHNYPYAVRCFLRELERRGATVETVSPTDVEQYLDALRLKRCHGPFPDHSRRMHQAAIHLLLRLVHGRWPPPAVPTTERELLERETVVAFDMWMKELRGLSASTRRHRRAEARWLLKWWHERCGATPLSALSVAELDVYVSSRAAAMRRTSIAEMVSTLRCVLRYLHGSGQIPADLAGSIQGPTIHALEGIPTTLRSEDVERALKAAQHDRSPLGRRDYAILMLLATYGLRAGEITALRLADIDWRHERLRIRHTKTGADLELPLLRGPADALLDYLRRGRPTTTVREVFLRACAPYRALTGLHAVVTRRLAAVGVHPPGKRGPHALRHARAVGLLRGGVPLKVIGDVLGHRSARSTAVYLKLATDDLRSVALDLPVGVSP